MKENYDKLLSSFSFKFNLRRYSEEFWQDLLSVLALSVAFAVLVWAGQRGHGPLKLLLRVTAADDTAPDTGGDTTDNTHGDTGVNAANNTASNTADNTADNTDGNTGSGAAGKAARNEVAAAAHTGVVVSCEWILAVAWVGMLRHGMDIVFVGGVGAKAGEGGSGGRAW